MLIPSGNLQDWIDNQNKQVRNESDIKIEVFSHNSSGICTLDTTINKSNLEKYSINESGSILGFQNPSVEISFVIFKDNETEKLIKIGSFIRISYGYLINGFWSWVEKGVYEISYAKVQNNGLTAEYKATFLRYQALEQEWIYGGVGRAMANTDTNAKTWIRETLIPAIRSFDNNLSIVWNIYTNETVGKTGIGPFSSRSILSILTNMCQAIGICLKISGYIDSNNRYGIRFDGIDKLTNQIYTVDYNINDINKLKKYEIVDEDYYDGVDIFETYAIPDIPSYGHVSSTTVNIIVEQINTYIEFIYLDNKYPLDIDTYADLWYTGGTGDKGTGKVVPYGNGALVDYPNSTLANPDELFINFAFARLSKVKHEDSGKSKLVIDNPFVVWEKSAYGTVEQHKYYERIRNYQDYWKKYQKHISLEVRFDPRLELFDDAVFDIKNGINCCGIVEEYSIDYDGSFNGTLTLRNSNEVSDDLTLEFLEYSTFQIEGSGGTKQLEYSINGKGWNTYNIKTSNYEVLTLNQGDKLQLRGKLTSLEGQRIRTGRCRLSGFIMSLFDNSLTIKGYALQHLFENAQVVGIDNENLLNATKLSAHSYNAVFGNYFEEDVVLKIPAKNILANSIYSMFGDTDVKITLDLTDAEILNGGSLYSISTNSSGEYDLIFGKKLTSLPLAYISTLSGRTINYYFKEFGFNEIPLFDVKNAVVNGNFKNIYTANLYTDNYLIANASVIKNNVNMTTNCYKLNGSRWNVLQSPAVTRNRDGSITLSGNGSVGFSVYNIVNFEKYADCSSIFYPTTLNLNNNNDVQLAFRSLTNRTDMLSSKLSAQINIWYWNNETTFFVDSHAAPATDLSENTLTITPQGGENKFIIAFVGQTGGSSGVYLLYETTDTTIDLTTIPNLVAGTYTVSVRGYYNGSSYDTVSAYGSFKTWTKS